MDYDDLTAIAVGICGTEMSLISLLDDKRQWFKSSHGTEIKETPKEFAFCAHAIHDAENVFIVPDAKKDKRFKDNPLVTGNPHLVFYAGVPLISDNGLPLGTLCVLDHQPKSLNEGQIKSLTALGRQVMNLLNLRKTKITLENTLSDLEAKNIELERFASIAAHDLKSPLNGISGLALLLSEHYGSQLDDDGKEIIDLITKSSDKLKKLIEGLLAHTRSDHGPKADKTQINL
jgi:GAF domain-containing protein